jgi:UDP-glucose 4-epimerase
MKVLVTGGAGYIGSVTAAELLKAGHQVVVFDNLSQGHQAAVPAGAELIVGDLLDAAAVGRIFAQHAEFTSSLVRLPSSLDAAASAERVRQSYLRQFISGRRSWLDVMNSFQETTSADISVVDTETTALSAMDRLLLLTGRWRLDIKDPSQ